MRGQFLGNKLLLTLKCKICAIFFVFYKTAKYCLEPEPVPEPEPEPKLFQSRNRTRNHNRSLRFYNTTKSAAINKPRTYDSLNRRIKESL
jgi:hypothetical protein